MTCYNDQPTLNDHLEWVSEVNRMKRRILESPTPHVFGVHGEWGIGKTSFMRQLQASLGGSMPQDSTVDTTDALILDSAEKRSLNKQVVTVWFDAWRYQNEKTPIVALLQEMRYQMSKVSAIRKQFEKIGEIAMYSVLDSLSDIGKIISLDGLPSVEKIEKRAEAWEREHFSETIQTDSIREHLARAIEFLLPVKNGRVVIFIDDLDRCNSRSVMRLLEGLKIYMSIPKCIFVLGMNERVLVDAIRDELSANQQVDPDEIKLRAAHYLEKICTDIFRVPVPRSALKLLMRWLPNAAERVALAAAIGDLQCLPPNPRRLKALANQWTRFSRCVDFPEKNDEQEIWAVRVLVALYIHQFHRDMWERLHFDKNFLDEIRAWCTGGRINPKPEWTKSLKLTYDEATGNSLEVSPSFPNPGDVENFWIGILIHKFEVHLTPLNFEPLLSAPGG
jgi:hypothetical protein